MSKRLLRSPSGRTPRNKAFPYSKERGGWGAGCRWPCPSAAPKDWRSAWNQADPKVGLRPTSKGGRFAAPYQPYRCASARYTRLKTGVESGWRAGSQARRPANRSGPPPPLSPPTHPHHHRRPDLAGVRGRGFNGRAARRLAALPAKPLPLGGADFRLSCVPRTSPSSASARNRTTDSCACLGPVLRNPRPLRASCAGRIRPSG